MRLFLFLTQFCYAAATYAQAVISPLTIEESFTVSAIEISGLAWRTNPETKHRELIVVGDRDHRLFIIDWENRKSEFKPRVVNLDKIANTKTDSGWESVFSDETGRIFIIKEDPSEILVVSSDLSRIENKISLSAPTNAKDAEAWNHDPNSRGEGILPLKNGHVLVVKEKKPLRIIEFAQLGNKPQGYNKDLSIEFTGKFPLPQVNQVSFSPNFTWNLDEKSELLMEDSSGLNVDRDGELYLLSDERNWIAGLGKSLSTKTKTIGIKKIWLMPSEIVKPEGMVIDDNKKAVIAVDSKKSDKPNLFVLSPMK